MVAAMSLMDLLIACLTYGLTLWGASVLLPGFEVKDGLVGALRVAILLLILHRIGLWLLFGVLDLDGLLQLGPTLNTALRWLVMTGLLLLTEKLTGSLAIRNAGMALVAAVAISLVQQRLSELLISALHHHF